MRRCAKLLKINRKTVARRVAYFAEKSRRELAEASAPGKPCGEIYFDELITFEHTRCKPLAVSMAVSRDREILSFAVSSMPPIGKHLKKIALKKYGKRPNHRRKGVRTTLQEISTRVDSSTIFISDEESSYSSLVSASYPGHKHIQHRSKRAVIAGQGELKDHAFDPLFAINHTLAMLRANLSRLVRRTWATTKKASRLEEFLQIYQAFHNLTLIGQDS